MFSLFVEVFERLAAELGMLFQVIVGAIGNALELAPAHGEQILDVDASLRIVGQLVRFMPSLANVFFLYSVALIPLKALIDPLSMPFFIRPRHTKIFDLHLLELAGAESKVSGRNFVAKGLADLGNTKR